MRHGCITLPPKWSRLQWHGCTYHRLWEQNPKFSHQWVKSWLLFFFYCEGVVYTEFMLKGTTINSDSYCETLRGLHKALKNKRHGKLSKGHCLLAWQCKTSQDMHNTEFASQFWMRGLAASTIQPRSGTLWLSRVCQAQRAFGWKTIFQWWPGSDNSSIMAPRSNFLLSGHRTISPNLLTNVCRDCEIL